MFLEKVRQLFQQFKVGATPALKQQPFPHIRSNPQATTTVRHSRSPLHQTFVVAWFHSLFRKTRHQKQIQVTCSASLTFLLMENSNSDGVVLPDISEAEQLASDHDGGDNNNGDSSAGEDSKPRIQVQQVRQQQQQQYATATTGVPVTSLPVGSLITTNFSVLTQDQLQQFKPMLCVDNNG